MKRNPLILLLITGICVFTTLASAQESNYITSKYDFIPGEEVIFFDDFSSDIIDNLLTHWLTDGSGEPGGGGKPGGVLTDKDGNSYKIVTIGSQVWMAENLKTTKFSDGTPIPLVQNDEEWGKMEAPAYCWMENKEADYKNTYGALYNWYAVNTGKLCPAGWHIPEVEEWEVLKQYLSGYEGTDNEGGMLKESGTAHWASPNSGATNETGFTGLPGGGRGHDGSFEDFVLGTFGNGGSWWCFTKQAQDGSYFVGLKSDSRGLFSGAGSATTYGISARCVKDFK